MNRGGEALGVERCFPSPNHLPANVLLRSAQDDVRGEGSLERPSSDFGVRFFG